MIRILAIGFTATLAVSAGVIVNIPAGAVYSANAPCPLQFGTGAICYTNAYLDDTTWAANNVLNGVSSNPRVVGPDFRYPARTFSSRFHCLECQWGAARVGRCRTGPWEASTI